MRKTIYVVLLFGLTLNACIPAFLQPQQSAPTADSQATIAAGLTSAAATFQPQASPTLLPPSATPTRTRTATPAASLTTTPSSESGTATVSGTPATATQTVFSTPLTGTAMTATNVTGTPGIPIVSTFMDGSFTATLGPMHYGTQPPAIDFGELVLVNKSKAEAYISIQCESSDGQASVSEYPVPRRLEVKAAAGECIYVAWVGGRKMTGQFHLGKSSQKTITMYKDRVAIK